jgi:hypothetical protein
MFKNLKKIALNTTLTSAVALAALAGTSAQAATQGTLGATSTGTVVITASVPARARITGLADVAFTSQDPNTAATNAQNICVWSNTSTKGYNVLATGSGASNAFTLANGSLTVPYSVELNSAAGQTSGTALTSGTASADQVSTANNQTCSGGETQSLIVGISTDDLGTMQATTTYTGTLTLVVAPV